ncbi:MAG: M18 family aminopeptidase [Eubacterium sp.]|nr:M18 family aminopeptidase [Eubacterium sp.]
MKKLEAFIKEGVSAYNCTQYAAKDLEKHGFEELHYADEWHLKAGGRYYMKHYGASLFAFTIGKKKGRLRMAGAHTDAPCLSIKPNADFVTKGYAQVNVEVYGGPILNTWFDRPLGVAGRVILKSKDVYHPKSVVYRSKKPLLILPNLAIHMNRDVNKGVEIKNQTDLMLIAGLLGEEGQDTAYFMDCIANDLKVNREEILDFELTTFIWEEAMYVGVSGEMYSAPRLDNQTSVAALVEAIEEADCIEGMNFIGLYDHEEIGSRSKQGAATHFTYELLQRILEQTGYTTEEVRRYMYEMILLSVDVAHGLHPNNIGKMDITTQPILGNGFCIKQACSQSYATDAEAIGIFAGLCEREGIRYQRFVNRSDVRGGGTIGAILSSLLPVKTVDLGVPLLAMHSARELMGSSDQQEITKAVTCFFND